jgi:queuine tRNA-ribosyltransferase
MSFRFEILAKDPLSRARVGRIETNHGSFSTPAFLPVGTQGTVKSLTPEELTEVGAEVILANTYHLYLRPGHEVIRKLGGLHTFIHWDRPILQTAAAIRSLAFAPFGKSQRKE